MIDWTPPQMPPVSSPRTYNVGPLTMVKVFKSAGLTNVHDLQAVLDAVEAALARP